jgi:hypothetical protein
MECACYLKMTVSERATLRPVSFTMAFALRLFRQKHSLVSCRSLEKYQILTYSIEIALFSDVRVDSARIDRIRFLNELDLVFVHVSALVPHIVEVLPRLATAHLP